MSNTLQNIKSVKRSEGTPLSTVKFDPNGNQLFSSDGVSVNDFMRKMGVKEREMNSC